MTDDKKISEYCFEADGKLVFNSWSESAQVPLYEKSPEERKDIYKVIPECDIVDLEMQDYSDATGIRFKDGAVVNLGGAEGLPSDLDISNCSEVDMSGRDLSTIPPQIMQEGSTFIYSNKLQSGLGVNNVKPFKNVDVSHCQRVVITNNDLSKVSDLKFRDGASVCLSGCTLPENLDVSKFSEMDLSYCDLNKIKELKFRDGASVCLSGCTLPENIDLSQCDSVNLSGCDLSNVAHLEFKEGAKINLSGAVLPDNLDLSQCDSVNLSGCDLSQIKNIKFKDGAVVNLSGCTNIPADLDVSSCSQVNFSKCDLSNVAHLEFKEGAKINLEKAILPDNADFSRCDSVNLKGCDLTQIKNIKFKDGARVNLQGAQFSDKIDVSNCKEVWLLPDQFDEVSIGEAQVVVGGVGRRDKIDFSKLKNFTVPSVVSDEILGNSYTSFLGSKKFVFKNEAQYKEFLGNDSNIAVPDGCNVSYADNVAEVMKEDQQKARIHAHRRSGQLTEKKQHPSTKKKVTVNNPFKRPKRPNDLKPHVEQNVSTYVNNQFRLIQR